MGMIPKDYVVEPGQSYTFDLFRPEDAEGVVHLFKTIYGEGYPIRTFIDAQTLIEENAAGRTISSVARTPKGDIVGHNAIFCSAPSKKVYESGAGLVHPNYSGGAGIFTKLGVHGVNTVAPQFGIEAVFGEPVCNHIYAQKAMAGQGWITHALEVDLMPGSAYDKDKSVSGRVSTLTIFKTLVSKPHLVYLPRVYEDPFRYLYTELDDVRELRLADSQPLPETASDLLVTYFDFAQVARIAVHRVGPEFISLLREEEEKLKARQVMVIQVWLNLSWPWIEAAVSELRAVGYFFGGLLPRWYDQDGMLMQKVFAPPHWEGIQLYYERAKRLLEWVRQDWERTLK